MDIEIQLPIEQTQQPTTPLKVKDHCTQMHQEISPDQSDSTITSTNQQQSEAHTFPQLLCYEHKSPIILVCQKKNCQQRPFLCARCVSGSLVHMNAHDPFIMYEDFIDYLKTLDRQQQQNSSTETLQSSTITETDIAAFQQNQQTQIDMFTEKMTQFKTMYEENFSGFIQKMKEVMMEQTRILQTNQEKMNYMKQVDFEMEAEIPNFFEIKQTCLKINDAKEMEQYLIHVLRRKQQWQSASENVKTIGAQTIQFYEQAIQNQLKNQPCFQNLDLTAEAWKNELTSTFDKFKNQHLCLDNLHNTQAQNFQIKLDKLSEIKLLTNSMLKPDIQLLISMAEKTITSQEFDEMITILVKLFSLQHLEFDFSQATLPLELMGKMLNVLKNMTKLHYLSLSLYGCGMSDKQVEKITESMSQLKNITTFVMDLGNNALTQTGLVCLCSSLREMEQLQHLTFSYANNKAKCQSLMMLAETIANMKLLETLKIDFSGFSQKRNNIKDEGFIKFVQTLAEMKTLKVLHLDFGYNQITEDSIYQLCATLKKLPILTEVYINFNKCSVITEKALEKLGKVMGKLRIQKVQLNLNSNKFGDEGAEKFVMGMKEAQYTKFLKINFRNVGMTNAKGLEMRNMLENNKNFKFIEFLF